MTLLNCMVRRGLVLLLFLGVKLLFNTSVKAQLLNLKEEQVNYPAFLDSMGHTPFKPSPFRQMMKAHKVKEVKLEADSSLTKPYYYKFFKADYELYSFDKNGNATYCKIQRKAYSFEEYYQSSPTGFLLTKYKKDPSGKLTDLNQVTYKYDQKKRQLSSFFTTEAPKATSDYTYYKLTDEKIVAEEKYLNKIIYKAETDSAGKILKLTSWGSTYVFNYGNDAILDSASYYVGEETERPMWIYVCNASGLIEYRKDYAVTANGPPKCVVVFRYRYKYYE
jgi:hypothetical protein